MCIVSGPGALPLSRNLIKLMFGDQHRPQARAHFPPQTGSHLGPQEDKNIDSYPQ